MKKPKASRYETEFEKMKRDWKREEQLEASNLVCTGEMLEPWLAVVKSLQRAANEALGAKLTEYEGLIEDQARVEWGKDTKCLFDRQRMIVTVYNSAGQHKEFFFT